MGDVQVFSVYKRSWLGNREDVYQVLRKLNWLLKKLLSLLLKRIMRRKRIGNFYHMFLSQMTKLMKLLLNSLISGKLMLTSKDLKVKIKKKRGKKGKKNKIIYKVGKKRRYIVRFIHGVLLCKQLNPPKDATNKGFRELIPLLRKVAGMPEKSGDAERKKVTEKAKKRGIKVHGGS